MFFHLNKDRERLLAMLFSKELSQLASAAPEDKTAVQLQMAEEYRTAQELLKQKGALSHDASMILELMLAHRDPALADAAAPEKASVPDFSENARSLMRQCKPTLLSVLPGAHAKDTVTVAVGLVNEGEKTVDGHCNALVRWEGHVVGTVCIPFPVGGLKPGQSADVVAALPSSHTFEEDKTVVWFEEGVLYQLQ